MKAEQAKDFFVDVAAFTLLVGPSFAQGEILLDSERLPARSLVEIFPSSEELKQWKTLVGSDAQLSAIYNDIISNRHVITDVEVKFIVCSEDLELSKKFITLLAVHACNKLTSSTERVIVNSTPELDSLFKIAQLVREPEGKFCDELHSSEIRNLLAKLLFVTYDLSKTKYEEFGIAGEDQPTGSLQYLPRKLFDELASLPLAHLPSELESSQRELFLYAIDDVCGSFLAGATNADWREERLADRHLLAALQVINSFSEHANYANYALPKLEKIVKYLLLDFPETNFTMDQVYTLVEGMDAFVEAANNSPEPTKRRAEKVFIDVLNNAQASFNHINLSYTALRRIDSPVMLRYEKTLTSVFKRCVSGGFGEPDYATTFLALGIASDFRSKVDNKIWCREKGRELYKLAQDFDAPENFLDKLKRLLPPL